LDEYRLLEINYVFIVEIHRGVVGLKKWGTSCGLE